MKTFTITISIPPSVTTESRLRAYMKRRFGILLNSNRSDEEYPWGLFWNEEMRSLFGELEWWEEARGRGDGWAKLTLYDAQYYKKFRPNGYENLMKSRRRCI